MHSRTTTTIEDPKNPGHVKTFTFDSAYWSHDGFQKDKDGVLISADPTSKFASQRDVFHDIGRGILDSAWQGYNATLLAYGQTGAGKSYSMVGFGADKGVIPSVCEELFEAIEKQDCLEIYGFFIRDLLSRTKKPGGLKVREDQNMGFYVEGLTSVPCENYAQIEKLMEQGTRIRTTASTNMNASSSRSHMVTTIQFKQVFPDRALTKQSSINLVDLAGSERQKSSGSEGDRLREGSRVNLSLTNLGNVISALADAALRKKVLHIPYRDSVLTKLLQSALGGNSRTTLIAAISPADICYEETLSTLRYAERSGNKAVVNTCTLSRESRAENDKLLLRFYGWSKEISDKHASFTNLDGKVTVTPYSKCKVVVNGVPITTRTKLHHLDRIILGSSSAYLYVGFPSERSSEDLSRFDYDFFQLERAAVEGVSVDKLGAVSSGDGQADPSVLAVFQDYIKLRPLVAEANQMSEELKKGLEMELKVKNLASSDSRGYDLQKEVMVKVTNQRTHEVWIWSKAKFINRKFLMEELYQRFLEGEDSCVAQEDDPFWDPVEVIHLGSAHIWLQSLAYCMQFEDQVEFLNSDGLEEAVLHIHITPCSPTGRAHSEEEVVIDPLELLGKRIDFQIHIVRCLGIKWLKEAARRGIQMGYRIYDLPITLYTKPVWKTVNPQIEETVQFAAFSASQEFLNYLQTNALIVDLWGLQGTLLISFAWCTAEINQICTQQASCDKEFAKALKVFYQSMNLARAQFLRVRQHKPPEDDQMLRPFIHQQSQMLKDFGDLLESSLWKLKNDIALIVKKKREYLLRIKQ
uniref:Kinesin-like protein n=1 Tax=Cavia porcellus TaxID=10141 RepID=A0A286XRU6_CAVPO